VIHSEAEYHAALDEADALMDAAPGTPECARLSELADEIVAYEDVRWYEVHPDSTTSDVPMGQVIIVDAMAEDRHGT